MVYRGKPSAGCENCRKAKKRCGLELPSCNRCVKLKKICSGYRDTTALQIQDETDSVTRKAESHKAKSIPHSHASTPTPPPKRSHLAPPTITDSLAGIPTPGSINSDSTSSSDSTIDLDMLDIDIDLDTLDLYNPSYTGDIDMDWAGFMTIPLKPKPDEVATNFFFKQFTSNSHWAFMQSLMSSPKVDPCVELAMKAVGMAALNNTQNVVMGKDYARSMYVEALGLLNQALRDPKMSKKDESLIAVSMLGYFETLTCDGRDSIQSWKAHIAGATQLLKLRGKAQFKSPIGRILFRETRYQILTHCIWDDLYPPDFLREYEEELSKNTEENFVAIPGDKMTSLCHDFAVLRYKMCHQEIPDKEAAEQASELERGFIQWQIDTIAHDSRWRYHEIEVTDSEHVWDGRVHAYTPGPAPQAWNVYRCMRIMLSRTQEMLYQKFNFSEAELDEQMQYFRKTRRQLTDEICATVPACLGHASPASNSACVFVSAYASIWPLFFAGTCTLERVGTDAWSVLKGEPSAAGQKISAATAQAMWIMSRLEYISSNVGLKWADGVISTLRGDFRLPDEHLAAYEPITNRMAELLGKEPKIDNTIKTVTDALARYDRPAWLGQVEEARRGPKFLIETPSPLSDALAKESAKTRPAPIWLGREAGTEFKSNAPLNEGLGGFDRGRIVGLHTTSIPRP